ncbi:hypothetical protein [Caviibacter abscessus]|uniref:hypothetical protein n=1 Tax=Caviibacter abscessus TaxID=1766719 RepID=UPI0008357468|nr:hypothetical protein [Caviibacter abscessus]
MYSKKLFKISIFIGVIGLAILLLIVFSGVVYPNQFFKIFMPIGLLLMFISFVMCFVSWILMIKDAVASKNYKSAWVIFFIGMMIIIIQLFKIIFR